jgi:outer membrane protein assembly factor BamB
VNNSDDIFIALSNGDLFSFDILLGKKNWEYSKYNLTPSLSVSEDRRLIFSKSSDDRFHFLSANLGTWVKELYTNIGKHHTITDITEINDQIYFGDDEGFVYQIKSNYNIDKLFRLNNSAVHSVKKYADNKLVIATHDGFISLLNLGK